MFDTPHSAVMDGEGGVIYVDGGLPSKGIFRLNGGAIPLTEAELIWDPSDHLEIADISGFDIRVKDGEIWVTNAEIFGGIAQRVLRLVDKDGDGKFNSEGETIVWLEGTPPLERVHALEL